MSERSYFVDHDRCVLGLSVVEQDKLSVVQSPGSDYWARGGALNCSAVLGG